MGARRGGRAGLIIVVLIILILIVAVVGILFLGTLTNGNQQNNNANNPATPTEVTTKKIIVAAGPIVRGKRLEAGDVTLTDWPDSVTLPDGALVVEADADLAAQIDGMISRVDIVQGQPILQSMIANEKDLTLQSTGSDAALLIPSGQVAVAFPLSRMSSVAFALRPGDHVDVLMSYRVVSVDKDFQSLLPNNVGAAVAFPSNTQGASQPPPIAVAGREENGPFSTKIMVVPAEPQRPRQVTQLVIKNAIVLRIGDWPLTDQSIVVTPEAQSTQAAATQGAENAPTPVPPPAPDIITIVMSRQDALVLKYSLETGADIDFALRSALDNDVTDVSTDSVTLQYLMDFYDIVEPPLLPIAQDPRIDKITSPTGDFQPSTGDSGAAAATPPPQ